MAAGSEAMSEELEKLRLECERAWSEVDEVARERDVLRAELAQPDFRFTGSRLRRAGHGLW